MLTMDYLRREANANRREDFARYLDRCAQPEVSLNDRADGTN